MRINIDDWINKVLSSKRRYTMPLLTSTGYQLIKKNIIDGIKKAEIQYRAIDALNDNYPFSACPMMMDLSIEAEAFGAEIKYTDNEVPSVTGSLINDTAKIRSLSVPPFTARINEYIKAAELCVANINDKPVFAGCIGPFSLAGRLFGMTELMTEMIMSPDEILSLVEKCTAFLENFISAYKDTGVNGVVMAEPAAGMLSPELSDDFSSSFIKKIVDKYQDDGFVIILHNCGNNGILNGSMVKTGARVLHLSSNNDLKKTLSEIPPDIIVMGNIDPVRIIKNRSAAVIKEKITALLNELKDHRNFILSSGCDIPPGVPEENIKAFFDAVEEYNNI